MSTLDGQTLFASGPHRVRPGSWERASMQRGFAGVDGELVLDMGRRSRPIVQDGRLQAATAAELTELAEQVEAFLDGLTHTLVDDHGRTFQRVIVEHFEATTGLLLGRGYWCDYTLRYRQLP